MIEETNSKVLDIVANIVKNQEDKLEEAQKEDEEEVEIKTKKEPIRGIPKSGRFWKSKKERFSTINKTKGLKSSFEKKNALRIQTQKIKELSRQMKEEIKQTELERKERRRQNIKRTEENKRNSEVVQMITNTAKLRRMKKKHLRFIEKRDTNTNVEVKQQ